MSAATIPLAPNQDNVEGWKSVQLDPLEAGSANLVKEVEDYMMGFASSANIVHDEDVDGHYSVNRSEFVLHTKTPAVTMTVQKLYPETLKLFGQRTVLEEYIVKIEESTLSSLSGAAATTAEPDPDAPKAIPGIAYREKTVYDESADRRQMFGTHPVQATSQWAEIDDTMEIPLGINFTNPEICQERPLVLLMANYHGYGEMASLSRNPTHLRAKRFKIDSKVMTFKAAAATDLRAGDDIYSYHNLSSLCKVDYEVMKYTPVRMRFYHIDRAHSRRKLLWHDGELTSSIEVRRCVRFNYEIRPHGAWDSDGCMTLLTDPVSTVCECGQFGSYAVIAELAEAPAYPEQWEWLDIVCNVGYGLSLFSLVLFVVGILLRSEIRSDMFFILRCHFAIYLMVAIGAMVSADLMDLNDRHLNMIISGIKYFSFQTAAGTLLCDSYAMFRAVTVGVIGGKTWAYLPLAFGQPFLSFGATLYRHGQDFGSDPRAFVGWENETKFIFFYSMVPMTAVSNHSPNLVFWSVEISRLWCVVLLLLVVYKQIEGHQYQFIERLLVVYKQIEGHSMKCNFSRSSECIPLNLTLLAPEKSYHRDQSWENPKRHP